MACISPISIKNPKRLNNRFYKGKNQNEKVWSVVPCGKCPECLKARSNSWSFRLTTHDKVAKNALFLTLTYAPENVPKTENGFMTLRRRDFQLFMKRLRKLHPSGSGIKYYAVGEYGSTTERPHYHAIIYNVAANESDVSVLEKAWSLNGQLIGSVHVGSVTPASINYTVKYIHKGSKVPKHARDDREKEKSLSSLKLGANYLTDGMIQWHHDDLSRNYVIHPGGFKSPLPRYYRDKIYDGFQREQQLPIMQQLLQKKEEERKKNFVLRTGSDQGYDRAVHESNKSKFENFYRKENEKRRKI